MAPPPLRSVTSGAGPPVVLLPAFGLSPLVYLRVVDRLAPTHRVLVPWVWGTGQRWSYDTVVEALPASTVWLMIGGGVVYAAGVAFHVWEGLRFQNAVWHSFVLVASVLFYSAILDGVVLVEA